MNEIVKTIIERRSQRTYTSEPVKKEDLEVIVEAGLYAPSAFNQQPWHFSVIQDASLLDELSFEAKEVGKTFKNEQVKAMSNNEKFHVFYNAPAAIIVSVEKNKIEAELDCAVATQNMLLAAQALGLGSCWIGFVGFLFKGNPEKSKEYATRLGIPEDYTPSHAIVIGQKNDTITHAPKRRENKVNFVD